MNESDLVALRNPLLVMIAFLVIAAAAVYSTVQIKESARKQLAEQETRLKEAQTRLQKSGDEKDIIVRYRDAFRGLERAGFVGEEKRINWLDGLRLTNQRADLFGVDYEVSAQKKYRHAVALDPKQVALYESVMRLRFRLLHEEDLLRFFEILTQQNVGIFHLNQCDVRRIDTRGVIRYQPNLSVDCELSWITAKVPAAGVPK